MSAFWIKTPTLQRRHTKINKILCRFIFFGGNITLLEAGSFQAIEGKILELTSFRLYEWTWSDFVGSRFTEYVNSQMQFAKLQFSLKSGFNFVDLWANLPYKSSLKSHYTYTYNELLGKSAPLCNPTLQNQSKIGCSNCKNT